MDKYKLSLVLLAGCTVCNGQFLDDFRDAPAGTTPAGWAHGSGDGQAVISCSAMPRTPRILVWSGGTEILAGDPAWEPDNVTWSSFLKGAAEND